MLPSRDEDDSSLVAILLGAQEFPYHEKLNNPAFGSSNDAVLRYLQDGLQLRAEQILNLFDDPSNVIELDDRISSFLARKSNSKNIIIFYVGHGGFLSDREYYLVIRSTRKEKEHTTGLRLKALAETLNQFVGERNLFLILDCCFAGEAVDIFQSTELAALVEAKTFDALPEAGTALLVAASRDEPAISPADQQYTMFSESFLKVLTDGIPTSASKLSLHDVAKQTQRIIRAKYGQLGVRPEVHSPRQKGLDIAELPLFPNRMAKAEGLSQRADIPRHADLELVELRRFDDVANAFIVSSTIVTAELIAIISDAFFDVRESLRFIDDTNKQLKALDSSAIPVRRGNLVLHSTAFAFWQSLFDEAGLQGHRTLAVLLYLITHAIPVELRSVIVNTIDAVIADYRDQRGRL